jgi:hypothetical protein
VEQAEGRDIESLETLSTFLTTPVSRARRAGHGSAHLSEAAREELMAAAEAPLENATRNVAELSQSLDARAETSEGVTAEHALDSLLFARMKAPASRVANFERKVMSGVPDTSPTPSETWHRTRLTPDIEISSRDDIDPDRRRVLEDLIARVKDVFGK